jgi:2-polyprenyl-3-methyl-5-hydroxy-6-metoxy-1,4-benzoquinol methylase
VPTIASSREIRSDFDTIAALTPKGDRLGPHEAWVLENLPDRPGGTVVEIGCGAGHLSRRLSRMFARVVAIDFSEGMIDQAKLRSAGHANIEYVCADLLEWLPQYRNTFECIVTVGTLHHVDLRSVLRAMALALAPGGTLLVLDLVDRGGWRHVPINLVAWLAARAREAVIFGGMVPWRLRSAFWRHGRNETYLTLRAVEEIVQGELPDAQVRGHLLWRYSIVWTKP